MNSFGNYGYLSSDVKKMILHFFRNKILHEMTSKFAWLLQYENLLIIIIFFMVHFILPPNESEEKNKISMA